METMWERSEYPYRGVALKPHMLEEIAQRTVRPGGILKRKWLVNEAPRIHVELGGEPTNADPISQAKKARSRLLDAGWEEAGYGSIRRPGDSTEKDNGLFEEEELLDAELDAQEWFGRGDETIYCYTFPCYMELASLKQSSSMPIKIGMTADSSLHRVSIQCGTSNPESPIVLFAVRVDDARLFEGAIHRILRIWNRWIEDAPGTEWYNTSKQEILHIVDFLRDPLL